MIFTPFELTFFLGQCPMIGFKIFQFFAIKTGWTHDPTFLGAYYYKGVLSIDFFFFNTYLDVPTVERFWDNLYKKFGG